MLVDAAKPIALALCMAALCGVFSSAFLVPANSPEQNMGNTLTLLSLAAGICIVSGMLFRENAGGEVETLLRTLPVQMFLWAAGVMAALFMASWYLETHCVFYRDLRRF
jgi:hypothetical protein